MNYRIVFYMLGRILQIESALLSLPVITSIIYQEKCLIYLLITMAISGIAGTVLTVICKKRDSMIYVKEGFMIVALAWMFMSAIGALPFFMSGEIPSYIDALFETVSGFTTTGASILANVESMSRGLLFWRSFTHWIGGMGVLVFIMAIFPQESGRSIHIMRAEMPGPIVGKLVPKIRETAKILYLIYIALTVMEIILLFIGGMSFFESVLHSFGTAGTGGFGIKADSLAVYSSYLQWVITIFMLIFGVNFNLYYLVLIRKVKTALKSSELWCYVAIVAISIIAISVNIYSMYDGLAETLRHSSFQVASLITTTGYSTTDFNMWPEFSKSLITVLMFVGGCAGSTAGGLKISRIMLLFKAIFRDLKHTIYPRSVASVKLEGKKIDSNTIGGVTTYFALYIMMFVGIFILLSIDSFDFETTFTATSACFNNIGPGLSSVGPMSSFAGFSPFSKVVLSFAMLLGRLEIFPVLVLFSPGFWRKK